MDLFSGMSGRSQGSRARTVERVLVLTVKNRWPWKRENRGSYGNEMVGKRIIPEKYVFKKFFEVFWKWIG